MSIQLYNGERLTERKQIGDQILFPYLPSAKLVKAVQLAQILKRPLLVKGEPGCGKSKLAEAIAYELFGENFKDFYFEWNIKSTSRAREGLYEIENLQRLSDANIKAGDKQDLEIRLPKDANGKYEKEGNYIKLGVLGRAFQLSNSAGLANPPIVLIDEIDKADIDFPNDLLLELDKMEFVIPEAKNENGGAVTLKANKDLRPLVIITSNDEKPLPPAFLRRCMFHYIDFNDIKFLEIVESKFPELKKNKATLEIAVEAFKGWHKKIEEKGTSNKNITTSELLDWIELIDHYKKIETKNVEFTEDNLPIYYQALLKDVETIQLFAEKNDKS